ncbi:FHA domain-containing protein [Corticibacter populi]|uniref:FHA domain-containing protein n=1 Tax=Corticibacter populi TaxID=1550736 RepID=A0A3M6QP79_9BURK|nr:ATPase, T2SS/T4P/T4SS family [Corticibacter populi]RMX04873.1 FHA domain-containing protein [Corticibacter populi]RZS33704.1 pilus assembly protein CpaF [Corticibacter populi]
MLYLQVSNGKSAAQAHSHDGQRCVCGRSQKCDLPLSGWKVHAQHAEFFVSNGQVYVRDLGSVFGTFVGDNRITSYGPLGAEEAVRIGGYSITAQWGKLRSPDGSDQASEADRPAAADRAPEAMPAGAGGVTAPVPAMAGGAAQAGGDARQTTVVIDQQWLHYRRVIHELLIQAFDVRRMDVHNMDDGELRRLTEQAIAEIFRNMPDEIPKDVDRTRLLQEVRDEAIGLGLLEPLLADPTTTEIMVNRVDEIFVESEGRLRRLPLAFSSEKTMMGIIERIVAPVGRRIDESSPLVDARLKDGSRFNAIIPPLALKGPSMTIRKFAKRKLDARDLLRFGSANEQMVSFLQTAVQNRMNIIVSGGTGSGKTTLLNILSNFIPDGERIVTIEDAAELQLPHEHLVSLESRPPNAEGKGQVAIRDLVKNSLRMRPDRIVVGECRGGEALDMLQAMNTGHDGSLTTAHANSPRDMLARLEVMVLMAGMDLPVTAIREQVASAVDIIVQQTRFACGSRKITRITEVTGVESGKIQLLDLFQFVETGVTEDHKTAGYFTGCDAVPEFYQKLRQIGLDVDLDIFKKVSP